MTVKERFTKTEYVDDNTVRERYNLLLHGKKFPRYTVKFKKIYHKGKEIKTAHIICNPEQLQHLRLEIFSYTGVYPADMAQAVSMIEKMNRISYLTTGRRKIAADYVTISLYHNKAFIKGVRLPYRLPSTQEILMD